MQKAFALHVLQTMFEEAQASRPPGRTRLAALLGCPPSAIEAALQRLELQGLVDAERARLTFTGLAVAVASRSSRASRTLAA
jgi:Mn-dependent DtxR family transcriptional regulator